MFDEIDKVVTRFDKVLDDMLEATSHAKEAMASARRTCLVNLSRDCDTLEEFINLVGSDDEQVYEVWEQVQGVDDLINMRNED